ncbi:Protein of unknown function [Roseovarius tolerans]|jgi:hypothetical protein|uniref:DUF2380 domain-containing protein n=1 Tax=Roseovarius tolerans TaxID=74031 RepID=A0A1H8BHU6_9RHOB|nr:DUF3280 domain-containing protein [Roseovarius tolerans]SEM82451.1 Protein of unknown function [Roseovarius tolerans]
MRLITLLFLGFASAATAGDKVAFFGLTLLDESLQSQMQGEDPAQIARIAMLEEIVRDRFLAEGYELLDITPVQADLDRIVNPAKCYGCDTRMATDLGADFSLVGEVQKVSNLILAMNLQLRDAETGDLVRGGVVDIRSNTDESWQRGMRYILKNRIFREEEK